MIVKPEQKIGMIFLALGVAMGFLSNQIGGMFAGILPIFIYAGAVYGMKKVFREKKGKWLVTNSVITFFLVWLVSWIFILNTV